MAFKIFNVVLQLTRSPSHRFCSLVLSEKIPGGKSCNWLLDKSLEIITGKLNRYTPDVCDDVSSNQSFVEAN